jgi:subtilisin
MTKKRQTQTRTVERRRNAKTALVSSSVEDLMLAALERGGDSFETGRYLVTFKENAAVQGLKSLAAHGLRVADTSDFKKSAATPENLNGADAMMFRAIGVALLGSDAAQAHVMTADDEITADSPIASIEPEYFVFADDVYGGRSAEHVSQRGEGTQALLGAARILETLFQEMQPRQSELEIQEEAAVVGATWGLTACRVPPSARNGIGIKIAVLGTGMDLGHPDFAGRAIVSQTFVGEPVQDLNGHGTHMIGTACGPKTPPGTTPRYGIGHRTQIFVGKIIGNSGSGTTATVLNGMNWAVANRCEVIYVPIASPGGPQPAYTAAGQAALNKGLLMIAGSSSAGSVVGAPANSPTIMSVGSVDPTLTPSAFSPAGKIEIAAPGRDIFSAWSRPVRYKTISGLATAGAHVAGCAALWAQHSANFRGMNLWNALQRSARTLPFPPSRVGAGLVQAP